MDVSGQEGQRVIRDGDWRTTRYTPPPLITSTQTFVLHPINRIQMEVLRDTNELLATCRVSESGARDQNQMLCCLMSATERAMLGARLTEMNHNAV